MTFGTPKKIVIQKSPIFFFTTPTYNSQEILSMWFLKNDIWSPYNLHWFPFPQGLVARAMLEVGEKTGKLTTWPRIRSVGFPPKKMPRFVTFPSFPQLKNQTNSHNSVVSWPHLKKFLSPTCFWIFGFLHGWVYQVCLYWFPTPFPHVRQSPPEPRIQLIKSTRLHFHLLASTPRFRPESTTRVGPDVTQATQLGGWIWSQDGVGKGLMGSMVRLVVVPWG